MVNSSLPVHSIADLVKYAKERPGQLSYASSGPGSTLQLSAELLKRMTGIEMMHVPYKGGPPAMTDLIAGHVHVLFADPASALAQLRMGKVRALGVASLRRTPAAPDIPPLTEAGLPDFDAVAWVLIVAPANTPKDIARKLNAELKIVVTAPDTREQTSRSAWCRSIRHRREQLQASSRAEIARWGEAGAASRHRRIRVTCRDNWMGGAMIRALLVPVVAAVLVSPQLMPAAQSQDYPNRQITIIAPWPAGGAVDPVCRAVAVPLTERLGKSVVVENRPGAGSVIGTAAGAKAAPDGYTLVHGGQRVTRHPLHHVQEAAL